MDVNSVKKLKKSLPGIRDDILLSDYTTFHVGGPASLFYIAKTNYELMKAVTSARQNGVAFFIIGGGSNILVSDKGFEGLVIKAENSGIAIDGYTIIAESGALLQKVVRKALEYNLSGMEFLISIPGSLGGAIVGNAGTSEQWISSIVNSVDIMQQDGTLILYQKSQCDFSYRLSRFKGSNVSTVLTVRLTLHRDDPAAIQRRISVHLEKRKYQPKVQGSIGSIFKNTPTEKAWEVIDRAGLRGKKIGGAQVSRDHANYIINTGNATAEDIVILVSYIKQQVRDQFGIQLQEEFEYVGF
ncbi:MAG: UDP-N-acetylmuramate dehydrogenase [Patescibacteria group bacterium]